MTDPSCLFDAQTQRFFVVSLTLDPQVNGPCQGVFSCVNHLDLAVSQTSDPTGRWNIYRIDVTNDGTNTGGVNPGPYLGDYPHMGDRLPGAERAGKFTTMRLILGLDTPTAGAAMVAGRPYRALRRPLLQVGAMLEVAAVHPGRSARNDLLALAAANAIPRRRVDEVPGPMGLKAVAGKRAGVRPRHDPAAGRRRRAAR